LSTTICKYISFGVEYLHIEEEGDSLKSQDFDSILDLHLLKKLLIGIGEVSKITGVPTRKIRYWEEKGIIQSEKENSGSTRKYNIVTIKKILLIKELIDDGFTLDAAAQKVESRIQRMNETFSQLLKEDSDSQ
jgi:predicted transcriptional regulator